MSDGSITSQLMFSVASSVNGSRRAESASGISSMSEASIPFQPAIDEPSNAWPCSNFSMVKLPGGHLDVLLLALGVGEAKVDELDLLLLDHLENIVRRQGHFFLLTEEGGRNPLGLKRRGLSAESMPRPGRR